MAAKAKAKQAEIIEAEWPASKTEPWPLDRIKPYPRNNKKHPREQVEALADDMLSDGVTQPVLVDEAGILIVGEGRWLAAKLNLSRGHKQFESYPTCVAIGWSEDQKRHARIKDNLRPLMAEWNVQNLQLEIGDLRSSGIEIAPMRLELTGLSLDLGPGGPGTPENNPDRGWLLELIDITIAEPKHQVTEGDHWILNGKHHLFCLSVIDAWPQWSEALIDGSLFCPYPGIFVPFSGKAEKHSLVMVQPDPYIAGHILDRYVEVNGKKSVKKA